SPSTHSAPRRPTQRRQKSRNSPAKIKMPSTTSAPRAVRATVNEHPRQARSRSRKTAKETTMATAAQTKIQPADQIAATTPDLAAEKTRQQAAWSSGHYAIGGTSLQMGGEVLCETLDLRA